MQKGVELLLVAVELAYLAVLVRVLQTELLVLGELLTAGWSLEWR